MLVRHVEHSEAALLVGDSEHPEWVDLATGLEGQRTECVGFTVEQGPEALQALVEALPSARTQAARSALALDNPAMIIYTSGTTGSPKGVLLSHGNLESNARTIASYLEIQPNDRTLCVLPFYFSYGNSVLHSHLWSGASIVLEDNLAFPQVTLRKLQDERITGFPGVPSTFAMLLRCRLEEFDLSSLRYLTQAGGHMPSAMVERLRQSIPHAKLFVMYGQTEATARISYLPPERLGDKLGSVGRPIDGVRVEVRDGSTVVPSGEVGEICVSGPNVMLGYWRNPEATRRALDDGWLRTGDLGYVDDEGFLYLTGRAVEMIKVGAFRVSPLEVEEVLATMDGIADAAVVGVADEMLGQVVKAIVVPEDGRALDVMAIKEHCRRNLASYKVPKFVEVTAALPRTSSGKVQRFKLIGESLAHGS